MQQITVIPNEKLQFIFSDGSLQIDISAEELKDKLTAVALNEDDENVDDTSDTDEGDTTPAPKKAKVKSAKKSKSK